MALYLGNQKVSLRSGQDPTFDYGFDSNGRLVFANKNAKEINNFLNYDYSYSEILDLSNLSKMEKVAVNGTADRKMEGLKGLLVSTNAPFTGSSPQINASYTGLNKSALVSLFESAPYNVGYEKVGNPTIVDGVASGFSASDYLNVSKLLNDLTNKDFECLIKGSNLGIYGVGARPVLYLGNNASVYITSSSSNVLGSLEGVLKTKKASESSYSQKVFFAWNAYPPSSGDYYIKYSKIGRIVTISGSIDNFETIQSSASYTLEEGEVISPSDIPPNIMSSDVWSNKPEATIDLKETYIKVNGVPWFTGKPAMTKTCSIVGCTGTADLTQEDKNIILNKGWSLTVQ